MNKKVVIFGGSTISPICNHLSLIGTYATGTTAKKLGQLVPSDMDVEFHLTKTAGGELETNDDIRHVIDSLVRDMSVKIVFFPISIVDFGVGNGSKNNKRLDSSQYHTLKIFPEDKLIGLIRKTRKDIFLVGFKQTCGASAQEQYIAGLNLCKKSSCNLVVANDYISRLNMIITPEEAKYCVSTDRDYVLKELMDMARMRSNLSFTRSTVVKGELIEWNSPLVFPALREVVDYCRNRGAYKPFNGVTTGHFACKIGEKQFITSIRKTDFNQLKHLVRIETDNDDRVIAYGAKPSVGGQSQRIVFSKYEDVDCIVHFHCPLKAGSVVHYVSQKEFECGSHECGQNTANGLGEFVLPNRQKIYAVYLDNHGPNIVFHHSVNSSQIIQFIEDTFINFLTMEIK
jgi:hypothetical protein